MDNYNAEFSLRKRVASFKFACSGIRNLIKYEHNARLHLFATLLVIIVGFLLDIALVEWLIIIVVITIVFISEIINSAIESIADFISPEYNLRIKKIKDYCAAAVLIASIASVMVGVIIFIPRIIQILSREQHLSTLDSSLDRPKFYSIKTNIFSFIEEGLKCEPCSIIVPLVLKSE